MSSFTNNPKLPGNWVYSENPEERAETPALNCDFITCWRVKKMIRHEALHMKTSSSLNAKGCVSLRGYILNLHRYMILPFKCHQIWSLLLDVNMACSLLRTAHSLLSVQVNRLKQLHSFKGYLLRTSLCSKLSYKRHDARKGPRPPLPRLLVNPAVPSYILYTGVSHVPQTPVHLDSMWVNKLSFPFDAVKETATHKHHKSVGLLQERWSFGSKDKEAKILYHLGKHREAGCF